jgi:hypothetical protein
MPPAFLASLSSEQGRAVKWLSHVKRTDSSSPEPYTEIAVPIVLGALFFLVFAVLFVVMYRAWRWERTELLKKQHNQPREEGTVQVGKAELSCESSAIICEMDSQRVDQELPVREEGLPHELPDADIVPQELPAASVYEILAEKDDDHNERERQSSEVVSVTRGNTPQTILRHSKFKEGRIA